MATFYCRMNGALPGGESWTTGFHVTGTGSAGDVRNSFGTAVGDLWNGNGTTVNGIAGHYSSGTKTTTIVVYELNVTTGKATASDQTSAVHAGTAVAIDMPTEVAVVATLRTATPGPRGRGRMYLPAPVVDAVAALGRFDGTAQQDFVDALVLMFADMETDGFTPVLFTPAATNRTITSIDVGDVFDAQRRRRDKLVETRISSVI